MGTVNRITDMNATARGAPLAVCIFTGAPGMFGNVFANLGNYLENDFLVLQRGTYS